MNKATVFSINDQEVLLLGLSFENLDRLRDGRPVDFDATEFGLKGRIRVMLLVGATEQASQT